MKLSDPILLVAFYLPGRDLIPSDAPSTPRPDLCRWRITRSGRGGGSGDDGLYKNKDPSVAPLLSQREFMPVEYYHEWEKGVAEGRRQPAYCKMGSQH